MTFPHPSQDFTLRIYLALAQYPILSSFIRTKMRQELFKRGIISNQAFETEVRQKAIQSQKLEGLNDPLTEEPYQLWEERLTHVRDHLTDFYFAYNLPFELFEQIIRQTLADRGRSLEDDLSTFNPELAPQSLLFEQGYLIERLPLPERLNYEARLLEIKAVLIRTMISDQLGYVQIAREWFTIQDLDNIRKRKIGSGKIGGKSAGMLLAHRILEQTADEDLRQHIRIPDSYFIGADLTYDILTINSLTHWMDQKYKSEEQIYQEFPQLQADFLQASLPQDCLTQLEKFLKKVRNRPIIVRSSSLLEDNFGTSFAGKYESHFCANQGTLAENLHALTQAILRVFASVFNPHALLYRRAKGLIDYDERMAILLQVVEGEQFKEFFLPHASGVAYSRNLYRWAPQIREQDGFLRLVWGLGTRAVERSGDDYVRLVALSHPTLHPEADVRVTRIYSQKFVDLINLNKNQFETLPVHQVLSYDYPPLRYIAHIDEGAYLLPIHSISHDIQINNALLTFDELFQRTKLAAYFTQMLQLLEKHYHSPVDLEFALKITETEIAATEVQICILQCRPQSAREKTTFSAVPNLEPTDILFSSARMAPSGVIEDIRYIVFIPPEAYYALSSDFERLRLRQMIAQVNQALANETFILIGPGRWGTSNPELGIAVGFGDIYHVRALIEITGKEIGPAPEASYGTHFFQDLIESQIYPLAIYLDDPGTIFQRDFFYLSPNQLPFLLPDFKDLLDCMRVIDVKEARRGYQLNLMMDPDKKIAMAYFVKEEG